MLMTVAPPAIVQLAAAFEKRPDRPKSYVMAGIVGNAAHMSPPEGYHVSARDEHFNWGGYSLSTTRDRAGGKQYPDYASAWDLHFDPADMVLVTTRLINAAKNPNDNRLHGVAEIAGTTDGHVVHAYYENTETDDPKDTGGWDSGHLTHVHLSISRDDCNNYDALAPILDVICGVPLEDEVTPADIEAIGDSFAKRFLGGADGKPHQIFTLDKMAVHAERNPFIVQFPKAPKNPGAVYLVTGGALLWLQPADYTGEGAPTVSPIVDHTTSAIYKLPILTGTPDPRI